jgi:hypothetical protein
MPTNYQRAIELLETIRTWMDRNQDKLEETQELIEITAEIEDILGEK